MSYRSLRNTDYAILQEDKATSHDELEEYLAWKRGEEVTISSLSRILSEEEVEQIKPAKRLIRLVSSIDEGSSFYVTATLRRRFHAIDDYLSEFPEADNFVLPCTSNTIKLAVEGLFSSYKLVDCIDCIRYLNPKRTSYYLHYNLAESTSSDLLDIASTLSHRERVDIIRANKSVSFPEEGLSYDILIPFLEADGAIEKIESLFEKYPSYLASYYAKFNLREKFVKLLTTAHFTDLPLSAPKDVTIELIENYIGAAVLPSQKLTLEEYRRLYTMAKMEHTMFHREESYLPMPYSINIHDYTRDDISYFFNHYMGIDQ
jgi:hypothetical protein